MDLKNQLNDIFNYRTKIIVTGGYGFIGSAMIRNLILNFDVQIFNFDKLSYSSDQTSISNIFNQNPKLKEKYKFFNLDISDFEKVNDLINSIQPDVIFHFAAESHVDRSIDSPQEFLSSNVVGTFNLLRSAQNYLKNQALQKREKFLFHHISTDEVFGTLGKTGSFNELSRYDPRSPYSASKACSDHFVNSWHHTYDFPTLITNCSNNYGPWQFPEKLIPLSIIKAIRCEQIPLYGDGQNIRDWLFVEDHIDALLLLSKYGKVGEKYCIGGNSEKTNFQVLKIICEILDKKMPREFKYSELINFVPDRPGHDKRYAIDFSKLFNELSWLPKYKFEEGISLTIDWYLENIIWCNKIQKKSNYIGQRLGTK